MATTRFKRQAVQISLALVTLIALSLLIVRQDSQAQPEAAGKPDLVVTILHTNDLHAHDEPFTERGRAVGGMARIGHLIRNIRKSGTNVLTIDAGDIFQGTPFFKFYHGEAEVALLNMAGYDIYTIGNHEFDEGPENLTKQLSKAKFEVISSNIDASAVPELDRLFKPSVVKTIDGRKVGFVGAITPDLEQSSLRTGAVHVKDKGANWINPIKTAVAKLKAEGIERIILVTHVGVEKDRQLAESIPEVDAIIGGHSHTRLDKPVTVKHEDGSATVIVQAGCYGRVLGKLRLAFDKEGRVILPAVDYHLINISDRIYEEADIKAYLLERSGPIQAMRQNVLGVALAEFDKSFARYPWDSPIGDLICDALAEEGTAYGASISFQNRGGIRAGMDKGPITMEKVEEVLPFENKLIFATVSGALLRKALEHGVAGHLGEKFLDVHGLKIAYDAGKPPGSRLEFVLVENGQGKWKELDDRDQYRIATNDYTFHGGEGFDFAAATNIQATSDRLAVVLSRYLQRHKQVTSAQPSRIARIQEGMLSVIEHAGKRQLKLKCSIPNARLTLVTGTGKGIEPIAGPLPVPLSDPQVIEAGIRADESGEYFWPLPLTLSDARRNSKSGKGAAKNSWAVAIAYPADKRTGARPLISSPIPLASTPFPN